MIDAPRLTADLAARMRPLVDDLRERAEAVPDIADRLLREHHAASTAERTAQDFTVWREGALTQAAASWLLSLTFVRFCEDNGLIETPLLAGPGDRLRVARGHSDVYFQQHPDHSHREYLEHVLRAAGRLPGMAGVLDPAHAALWRITPSADAARELLEFWRQIDPGTGALVHDFTDPAWGTRFLGDLYQHLSADARATYALLQTPEFIEEFILDRTLDPALAEVGLAGVSLIDPACGSGHFLLGAFARLVGRWQAAEPATNPGVLAQRALDQIAGVDLNPFAVAIARFRLLVAALRVSGARRLADALSFQTHLACGDSLLHGLGPPGTRRAQMRLAVERHHYSDEDAAALDAILHRTYTVVVGNPPYITPKDARLNAAYRDRFDSCHRQYSLGVPFTERFMDFATPASGGTAGWVGMITANSFMKREFGTKLVRELIPRWDLTTVIDTSGAYIPGHGTPTVILVLRNRPPVADTVRTVMGIRGEPTAPADPARGLVWSAIVAQVDRPGSESEWVSVDDLPRERFAEHPWTLGGGGAAALRRRMESSGLTASRLVEPPIGRAVRVAEEDAFVRPTWFRSRLDAPARVYLVGQVVRDWWSQPDEVVLDPYDDRAATTLPKLLWPWRRTLRGRATFSGSMGDSGDWWAYQQYTASAYRTPLSITFAFVATHNHFVLDRGGKVFNRSAPVIKLPAGATEREHLALLGPLNSSTGAFWMKQSFHGKGNQGVGGGIKDEEWERFWEHDGTKLKSFPLPADPPPDLAARIDALAQRLADLQPQAVCMRETPTRAGLAAARAEVESVRRQMIALQEELDWACYLAYGLIGEDLTLPPDEVPEVALGERAFEIVLARQVEAGDVTTAWFERHRSTPITEVPVRWPEAYRQLVERRIALMESDRDIGLIERPEYKRRWLEVPWADREAAALRGWLLDRLEDRALWFPGDRPTLRTVGQLADQMRADPDFADVLELLVGRPDFDLAAEVRRLVEPESVPYLAALRYTEDGLRKRAAWERVWDLQRAEDRGEAVGQIPVPPRYAKGDFRIAAAWTHRGKLDVPKERFTSYPGAERAPGPGGLVVGWAGFNHRERAQALAELVVAVRDEGWEADRLVPLLAGLRELLPWLRQWHDEPDASGIRFGEFIASFLAERCRAVGVTEDDLAAWRPPAPARGRRRRAATTTEA